MKKAVSLFAASLLFAACAFAVNSDVLISAKEALRLSKQPNVVFVSGDSPDVYANKHIDGSVEMQAHHLHHSDITGEMHCKPLYQCKEEAQELIRAKGISNNTLVIAYDDFRGPNATGVYHFFKMYGHDKVKILNGGLAAWEKAGGKVAKGPEKVAKRGTFTVKKVNTSIAATKDEVLKASNTITAITDKGGEKEKAPYIIIDSRSIIEIIGENKLDNVARGGHVPGATFMEWKQVTDFDNRLSFPEDLREVKRKLRMLGITPDKTIYTYCHVGAGRSSYFWTLLHEVLGYKNVKVYTGSWDEWGNDMNLPIRK